MDDKKKMIGEISEINKDEILQMANMFDLNANSKDIVCISVEDDGMTLKNVTRGRTIKLNDYAVVESIRNGKKLDSEVAMIEDSTRWVEKVKSAAKDSKFYDENCIEYWQDCQIQNVFREMETCIDKILKKRKATEKLLDKNFPERENKTQNIDESVYLEVLAYLQQRFEPMQSEHSSNGQEKEKN